jgi:hypothetical protein
MRTISVILLTYVVLLLVAPTVCNSMAQCSKEQTNNKNSDNTNTCASCCSIQNCNCNFTGVEQFDFQIYTSIITKKIQAQNNKILSNYLSECWHPPKIV